MPNKNYIQIPTIKSVKVNKYPLFQYHNSSCWQFHATDGINLILGANSIGKTTTMSMIIFAFVGKFQYVNKNYFFSRITKSEEKIKEQYISLHFSINNQNIEIQRNLNGNLSKFIIDKIDKPTSEYENFMYENTKINLEKLSELLQLLLIRIEDGNYILWDRNVQTKIMSILLNDITFQADFFKAENEYNKYQETVKDIESRSRNYKRQKEDLESLRDKERAERDNQINNIPQLRKKINDYQSQKNALTIEIERLFQELDREKTQETKIYTDLNEKIEAVRILETKIERLESDHRILKHSVPKFQIENNCILCKKAISQEKAEKIHKQYFIDKICPVCDNSLGVKTKEENPESIKQKIIICEDAIQSLNIKFIQAKNELSICQKNKNNYEQKVSNLRFLIKQKNSQYQNIQAEINSLNNQLDAITSQKPQPSDYDIPIKRIEDKIQELKLEESQTIRENKQLSINVTKMRKKRNDTLASFFKRLNEIFIKYSEKYFVENCELLFYTPTKQKEQITPLKNFAPKFKNKKRLFKNQVSHSQAIFLEYLFRVSLLELYFEKAKTKPFLFLETSEGAFDVANTESAAELFSSFAQDKFPVILVSNLSKEKFIDNLFKNEDEKHKKLFNLIRFGKLTKKQKDNEQLKLFC